MDNGIYVTLSRQMALFRDMDITSNNIANANTTAFNSEHILFNTLLKQDISQGTPNKVAFADNIRSYRNHEEGALVVTGNDLDLAIKGEGYFTVETPAGIRYTRAGKFERDATGQMVTSDGHPLLDVSGKPILLPDNATSITIGSAGNLKVNGEDFAIIGVVQFDNPQLLERLDNKLFRSEVPGQPAQDFTVTQGTLENSNVKPVVELTNMISISRSVADTAKFVEVMYDLQRKTSNTWAQQQ
ncbi:MAG: flagellar basal-body rod protein FlgF [Proteobacteria bacterium]|nr:flagellar basal-body rod protein FlgF [Pseudomonadota bacterium]